MLKYILGLLKNLFNPAVSLFAKIDYKSQVNKKAKIYHGAKVYNSTIDSYSYLGPKSEVVCADIGKFCSIAPRCTIGLGTHSLKNISTSPLFTSKRNGTGHSWASINTFQEIHRVSVGNDVWIGTKVIIMGGVKIGDGAIIGAGSIVTKNIPDYAIAVGIPAKVIKYRFEETIINKLLELKWWNLSENKLKDYIELFQIENFNLKDLNKINEEYLCSQIKPSS